MHSLKHKVIRGAFWSIGSNVVSQVLRLGGNLILTRLLFPDAFGLLALVQAFIVGVAMFADLGINASIIQNKRDDAEFLNTAWTLQVIRGGVLWLLVCIISWPVSLFYEENILMPLLIVSGFSSVILGFQSTKLILANRKVELKKIAITEITTATVGLSSMVIGVWLTQSVWGLVIGGLVQPLVIVFMSFTYFKGDNNSFHWDSDAFKSIYKYGRWLVLSSMITFLANQGDRLIIGRVFDVEFLGIYGIAIALVSAVYILSQKIGSAVFFPSYSTIIRDRPSDLYAAVRKARLAQVALLWPAAITFIFGGQEIVGFLYDDRYSDAGWMLEILSLGILIGVLRMSYSGLLMALGRTGVYTTLLFVQTMVTILCLLIGAHLGGQEGVIIGMALVSVVLYPIDSFAFSKFSLWQPELDIPVIAMSIIVFIMFLKFSL